MAGHRSPSGRRARRSGTGVPVRHLVSGSPPPTGPSLRVTILATAAAVGSVATGTFTALFPGDSGGPATSVAAPVIAALAASTAPAVSPPSPERVVTTHFAPVSFTVDATDDGFATADEHLTLLGKAADIAETLAAEVAEQLAQEQREQAERDRIEALIEEGGVDAWIAEALQVMDLPQSLAPGVKKIIMAESGGNPRAINNWDSNARRGTPSQGLMQTIPSTFRAYVHPDYADRAITDPIANITAGVRYMIANYGLDTLEAGGRSNSSGDYVGY